jgi:hypothetical protein
VFTDSAALPFRRFSTPLSLEAALTANDASMDSLLPRPAECPPALWARVALPCLTPSAEARATWAQLLRAWPSAAEWKPAAPVPAAAPAPLPTAAPAPAVASAPVPAPAVAVAPTLASAPAPAAPPAPTSGTGGIPAGGADDAGLDTTPAAVTAAPTPTHETAALPILPPSPLWAPAQSMHPAGQPAPGDTGSEATGPTPAPAPAQAPAAREGTSAEGPDTLVGAEASPEEDVDDGFYVVPAATSTSGHGATGATSSALLGGGIAQAVALAFV